MEICFIWIPVVLDVLGKDEEGVFVGNIAWVGMRAILGTSFLLIYNRIFMDMIFRKYVCQHVWFGI